ncbi:MAG: thermonuclease family protein [Nitrospirota bacterium]
MYIRFFLIILLCCAFASADAEGNEVVRGTVIKVIDGDTVIVRPYSGKLLKCRLYGVDAPEIPHDGKPGEPYGRAAERELINLVLNSSAEITLTGDSSYDREICIIRKMGVDVNLEMINRGYARVYRKFLKAPYASRYIEAETEARKMRRGLWRQSHTPQQ